MPDQHDKMLPFSRFAARLSRGKRIRRGDALLDTADPRAAVQALPPDEFYYLVAERGLPEAQELLLLSSPEQLQMLFDMELWDRDRLLPAKVEPWLSALIEAPFEQVYEWVRGLDVEITALLLRKRITLYDLTMGEEPESEAEGQFFKTPDGFFMVDALGSPDEQRVTQTLFEALYSIDLNYARRILVGLNQELDSELEEQAYRWRAGRLADLGFVDYFEALEVYAPLDPAAVVVGDEPGPRLQTVVDQEAFRAQAADALRMPTSLVETLSSQGSRFSRAVSRLTTDDQLTEIHAALVALCNRVLAADKVNPAAQDTVARVLARMQCTLDLALEYLARGDEAVETQALQTVPLVRLFRVGVSLIAKVGKLAHALTKESPFANVAAALPLWEPDDEQVLAPLVAHRPMFPCVLDQDPSGAKRPFSSLADVARATARLEQMAASLALLVALGLRPTMLLPDQWAKLGIRDANATTTGVLARTILVGRLLGNAQPGLVPLTTDELHAFAHLGFDVKERALQTLRAALPTGAWPAAADAVARRWVATLSPLEPVLVVRSRPEQQPV